LNVSNYSKILNWYKGNGSPDIQVHTTDEFTRIVQNERERSNRLKIPFSVLMISHHETTFDLYAQESINELINSIHARVRSIDVIAYANDQQIGVILPHTNFHGATHLAKEIQSMPLFAQLQLKIEVLEYPTNF